MQGAWAVLIVCFIVTLSGCATSSNFHKASAQLKASKHQSVEGEQTTQSLQAPAIYSLAFSQVDVSQHKIFQLSKGQEQAFMDYFNRPSLEHLRPYERVANYLLDFNQNFTYRGSTFNASEAFANKQGNCMSLTVLSSAIANLAGVDYKYRHIHSMPIFSKQNNVELVSSHVNMTLLDRQIDRETGDLSLGFITIDYFPESSHIKASRVTKNEVAIMYWHNLASEALLNNDVDLAFAYTLEANKLNPLHSETLNLLAILYNRKGHEELAYEVYDFMDRHKLATFTAVDNFAALLRQRHDYERANNLSDSIKSITESNPYTWINRGKAHFEEGRLTLASKYFTKATEKANYIHEPYLYLAQIYVQQRRIKAAREALEKAHSLAYLPEDEKRYKAKLAGLLSQN